MAVGDVIRNFDIFQEDWVLIHRENRDVINLQASRMRHIGMPLKMLKGQGDCLFLSQENHDVNKIPSIDAMSHIF